MIGFSGGSPYQIINMINIKKNVLNNASADLFAHTIGGYNKMEEVAKRIKELNVFSNVYEFSVYEFNNKNIIEELFGLRQEQIINEINQINLECNFDLAQKNYESIYMASGLDFNVRIINYFSYLNKEFKYYFYDEGIGQYFFQYCSANNRNSIFKNTYDVNFLTKYKSIMPPSSGRFLYEPKLIGFANINKIMQLPKISLQDQELIEIYNHVFNYKPDEALKNSKVIFFNSGFFAKDQKEKELKIFEIMEKYIGKENFVIKFHPSVKKIPEEYKKYQTMELKQVPFESFIMNDLSFADKLLISTSSSAILTPKLVFNLEPSFICISERYKIDKMSMFNKIRMVYNDKSKVRLVKDNKEFESYLQTQKFN